MELTKEILDTYTFKKVSHFSMATEGISNYICVQDARIKMQVVTRKNKNGVYGKGKTYLFFLGSNKNYPVNKINEFIKAFNEYYGNQDKV